MEPSAAASSNPTTRPARRRSTLRSAVAGLSALVLVLAACGGDDDDDGEAGDSSSTTTSAGADATTTTTAASTTTTVPPTTTLPPLELVTEGATVVVANASGVDGSAGRMTDALGAVGFTTGTATNSSEGPLATSKIYYDPDVAEAKAVADSLREALGAGDIEVLELTVPAPLSDPDTIGDAAVLLAMGNDTADVPLDELQGRVPAADAETDTTEASDEATDDASADATTEATSEATGEESDG